MEVERWEREVIEEISKFTMKNKNDRVIINLSPAQFQSLYH